MSSSKIQSRNLDPNMDLAKESSVQSVLEKVSHGGINVGGVNVVENVVKISTSPFKPVGVLPSNYNWMDSNDTHIFLFYYWFGMSDDGNITANNGHGLLIEKYDKFTFEFVDSVILNGQYQYAYQSGSYAFVNNSGIFVFDRNTQKLFQYDLSTFNKIGESGVITVAKDGTTQSIKPIAKDVDRDYIYYVNVLYYPSSGSQTTAVGYFNTNTMQFVNANHNATTLYLFKDYYYYISAQYIYKYNRINNTQISSWQYSTSNSSSFRMICDDILITDGKIFRITSKSQIGYITNHYSVYNIDAYKNSQIHTFANWDDYGCVEIADNTITNLYDKYGSIIYQDNDYIYFLNQTNNADIDNPSLIVCKYEPTYQSYGFKEVSAE